MLAPINRLSPNEPVMIQLPLSFPKLSRGLSLGGGQMTSIVVVCYFWALLSGRCRLGAGAWS